MSYEERRRAAIGTLHEALAIIKAPAVEPMATAPPCPTPPATTQPTKPWAGEFYRAAEGANIPVAELNAIVAVCNSRAEAMERVEARTPGAIAGSPPVRGDTSAAARLIANHARAHQPTRAAARRAARS